jgi:hypothetical protein
MVALGLDWVTKVVPTAVWMWAFPAETTPPTGNAALGIDNTVAKTPATAGRVWRISMQTSGDTHRFEIRIIFDFSLSRLL